MTDAALGGDAQYEGGAVGVYQRCVYQRCGFQVVSRSSEFSRTLETG